jgi:hypothetical protein
MLQYCTMMLNFFKNIAFTKLVKAAERLREYNFRRLPGNNEELFHVDVSDDRGNRIIFKMQKDAGGMWKITDSALPTWIINSEPRLHEAIEEELQRLSVA